MNKKISDFSELTTPADGDLFEIVDVSDTSEAATGTNKKIAYSNISIADATTTTAGKVELATDAETITGTDTARAVTPSNITAKMDTDGTLAGNLDTRIPSQKAVKTYADTKTTLATVLSTIASGWTSYTTVTPTYTSADDPTYTITFASVDLTSVMSVGMKVKFTNNATTFYGFITVIAFSTNTVVTLYGGTDYDVANSAITAFYYSQAKAPLGFPLDPTKWTVITTDVSARSQAAPTVNVWYNLGSMSQTIPIGVWLTSYQVYLYANDNTGTVLIDQGVTFSTANNSESDTDFTAQSYMYVNSAVAGSHGTTFHRSKTLVLAAKTTYYLNARALQTAPSGSFTFGNDQSKMVIRSICAYL